jgi:hypothetical protein
MRIGVRHASACFESAAWAVPLKKTGPIGCDAWPAERKAAELLPGDESAGNNHRAYKYLIEKGLKDLGPPAPPKGR